MADAERRAAIKQFIDFWKDKGYEKGHSQPFWLSLLRDIFYIKRPEQYITFEDQVHIDHTSFIDGYIDNTKVLIEQKSLDKDLYNPIKQSDGSYLTPFEQAKRYSIELPYSKRPRWVITCNFQKFCIYDMEQPNGKPQEILLEDLGKEYYRLEFLVDKHSEHIQKEEHVSKKAGDGQLAITHYKVIKSNGTYSLLDVNIDTGRKNQIRVHLGEKGHYIIGDDKYGKPANPIKRLGLHAYELDLIHPFTGKLMKFTSPMPKEFGILMDENNVK